MKRILFVAGVILTAVPLSAGPKTAPAGNWTPPRTSDGHPELQAYAKRLHDRPACKRARAD